MNRFASTRSEKRASQPDAGWAQWSVGSIEDDGIRYGLTTYALTSSTIATAPTIVTSQSTTTRIGSGSPRVRRSTGLRECRPRTGRRRRRSRTRPRRPAGARRRARGRPASSLSSRSARRKRRAAVVAVGRLAVEPSTSRGVSRSSTPLIRRSAAGSAPAASASIRAWSPERRTSGTSQPRYAAGACEVRVLETAVELGREALVLAGALGERARQAPGDRVEEHHRGQLAAGEHVRADRDGVGAEAADDPVVEALESRGEQRDLGLGGELLDELLVELPPLRGQRDDPRGPGVAVRGSRARRRRRRRGAPSRRHRRTGRRPPGPARSGVVSR